MMEHATPPLATRRVFILCPRLIIQVAKRRFSVWSFLANFLSFFIK